MIDICLKAGLLMVDSHKNQEVYGEIRIGDASS